MIDRIDSPVMGWPWESDGDKVSKVAALSSRLDVSEYKNIDNAIYNSYNELLGEGWGRFDVTSGAATAMSKAVAARTGLKLVDVFTWLSTMQTMAQEGKIDPKYWDPQTAEQITPEEKTPIEKFLEPVGQIMTPAMEQTGKIIDSGFNKMLLTLGAIGVIAYFVLRDANPRTLESITPDVSVF